MINPNVFISHASEDKERFVRDFVEKLRKNGVKPWFDEWEMQPGDSLVEKIFAGIGKADTFIIVLSKFSIDKKWVREELNSAIVKRIEKDMKIIPIVLDDLEIPTSLNHILRVQINDLSDYTDEFNQILSSIYNINKKPPLGDKPVYSIHNKTINGISDIDSLVFKTIGDILLKNNSIARLLKGWDLFKNISSENIGKEQLKDSLEILEYKGFIKITKTSSRDVNNYVFRLTPNGIMLYCENFLEEFEIMIKEIISLILNENLSDNKKITSKAKINVNIVSGILEYFAQKRYIKTFNGIDGTVTILQISASGKREFISLLEN